MNTTKTYDDVRKLGLDAQDRAYAKHLIASRDKWNQEAMDRFTLELRGKTANNEWSESAKAHADSLNADLERLLSKKAPDIEIDLSAKGAPAFRK